MDKGTFQTANNVDTLLPMKRYASIFLKIAVSVIGLVLVLSKIALGDIWLAMQSAQPFWIVVALLLIISSLFLRALRWQVLLQGLGANVNYWRLVELYFIGNFFNAFLLSGMGGDVVRAFEATKDISAENAAGTVIIDRLTGLLTTFALALLALPFRPASFPQTWFWLLLTVAGGGLAGGYLLLSGRLYDVVVWVLGGHSAEKSTRLTRIVDKYLLPILKTARSCGWPAIRRAFAVSFLFVLLLNGWWFAVARAYGLAEVTYFYLFLVTPIMSLALLVPSFSGLGVRELLLPTLLIGAGVSAEIAVVYSLTIFILQRITSLLGLPVYLRSLWTQRPASF